MGWTKTDHEGQVMWERDGERVREIPDEKLRREPKYNVVYRNKRTNPWWLL